MPAEKTNSPQPVNRYPSGVISVPTVESGDADHIGGVQRIAERLIRGGGREARASSSLISG